MKTKWVSIDGWRGYYEPIPPNGYELLLTCSVVNDAGGMLGRMLTKKLRRADIAYKTGWLKTSNVFSMSYYIIVEAGKLSPDIKEKLENWFIRNNNSTFSIFSGESWELDEEMARKELDEIAIPS